MATYPGIIKQRGVRSTTVVGGNATNESGAIVTRGALTSKARTGAATSLINAEDTKDPARLVRILNQLQTDVDAAHKAISSNPMSTPCIQRGCSAKSGETVAVPHTLKRNYSDWHMSRVTGGWTLVEVTDATLLAQYPTDQFLLLQNIGSAPVTFNVVIAGD